MLTAVPINRNSPASHQVRQAYVAGGRWIYTNPGPLDAACSRCLPPHIKGERPRDIWPTGSKSESSEQGSDFGEGRNGQHGAGVEGGAVLRTKPLPGGRKSVYHLL